MHYHRLIGEIPQNYHAFALFDAPKMGNLMTPVLRDDGIHLLCCRIQAMSLILCGQKTFQHRHFPG